VRRWGEYVTVSHKEGNSEYSSRQIGNLSTLVLIRRNPEYPLKIIRFGVLDAIYATWNAICET